MINWDSIDTVLLDMDGTLLDLHFDNYFWQRYVPRRYAESTGLAHDEALDYVHAQLDAHLGTLNWYCLDFWSRHLDMDMAALKREIRHHIALRPGAETFLQAVRASGRQVVMVTNAHPDALAIKAECTGIDRHFHGLHTSHDFGHAKEEAAFWDALAAERPFDPARSLLVDDSLKVLHAARDYGIAENWSILHPDSSLPPREHTEPFPAIADFDAVLPHPADSQPDKAGA
jgi:putative hydrolase of the HAD superfamily